MKYICKSLGNHFNPVEVTIGRVYDVTFEDSRWCFTDNEGDTRRLRDLFTDPYYGVWDRCGFSDYLRLLK